MSDTPPPSCPVCRATIVRRVAGWWCPRCRRFMVQRRIPIAGAPGDPITILAWGPDPRIL